MSTWRSRSRRDRHERGIRGPISLPNDWTGRPVRVARPLSDEQFFARAVSEAIAALEGRRPEILHGVSIGIEDVPNLPASWRHHRVPLAAAIESPDGSAAQVVLFRRPLEHRAASRRGLEILVRHTLVEQLAVVLGMPAEDIDPLGSGEEDES